MSTVPTTSGVWVEERGSGPAVLLLAGLGDPHDVWRPQLDGLSDRYRVIAPDNRGVGRTPMPADGVSIRAMAGDAAGLLRELGVDRAHVAGFSMGGLIAQELVLAHPGAVSSLVLLSTYGRADALLRRTIRSWSWLARTADDPAEEDFCAAAAACVEHDALDRLGAIRAPTLVVAGEEDLVTPPHVARGLAERIPGARLALLPAYAHQSFMEVPDQINAVLDGFFKEMTA